jgi:hypothetical protein
LEWSGDAWKGYCFRQKRAGMKLFTTNSLSSTKFSDDFTRN